MVNLKIDKIDVSVPEGTTVMEAAASVGIKIPSLCYLKNINEIAACRICLVELKGKDKVITSCNNVVHGRHGDLYEQPEGKKCPPYECAADPVPA